MLGVRPEHNGGWNEGSSPRDCRFGCRCRVLTHRQHTASSLAYLIRFSEAHGRLHCRMGAALACAILCGMRRRPSFDRTGSLTTSKRRWIRWPGRGTPRWRFRVGIRSRSIPIEMWITGCGNYDSRPNKSLQPALAALGRLSSTVRRRRRKF